ncbi:MAG: hypothetical protein HS119_06360 [Flavobacteriales bacterium]|nr:hypothetical protein [Flavobacteriales bacterium]
MKQVLLFGIIGLLPFACSTSSKLEKQMHDDKFLIKIQYKIIEHGYFTFIQLNDSVPEREIVFSYSINKRHNKFSVSLLESNTIKPSYDIKDYEISDKWNLKERNTWREKYYKIVHEKFLYMTNEQKFHLLDSLSLK